MSTYGMPPDDPTSFIPENTIHADSRAEYEQDAEIARDELVDSENVEADDDELPEG